MKTMTMILGASMLFLTACAGQVDPPQPQPKPETTIPVEVNLVDHYEIVTHYEGAWAMISTTCGAQGSSGSLLGGECRVRGNAKLKTSRYAEKDGWWCEADIAGGEIEITLVMDCLK